MWAALDHGYWIGLLLVAPAAGFLVRLFMIQHDATGRSSTAVLQTIGSAEPSVS